MYIDLESEDYIYIYIYIHTYICIYTHIYIYISRETVFGPPWFCLLHGTQLNTNVIRGRVKRACTKPIE